MSKPDVTVEIGIFNGFQLDDPEFGVLDTGVLDGGVSYTEVPQGVVSVSTSRGRNRDIGKTSAGSLSVSLRNEDRFFDPLAGSAFSDLVRPRLPIRVSVDQSDPVVASGGTVSDGSNGGFLTRTHSFDGAGSFVVSEGGVVTRVTNRRNLAENPSYEVDTARWSASNTSITRVTDFAQFGDHSLRVRATGTSNDSRANLLTSGGSGNVVSIFEPGKTYTVSGFVTTPVALSGSLSARARRIALFHRVGAGGFTEVLSTQGPVTGSARVSFTHTIPSDVTEVILRLYNGATNSATNDVFWDGILIEETSTLEPYFDGSVYDGSGEDVTSFAGAAHASVSSLQLTESVNLSPGTYSVNLLGGSFAYPLADFMFAGFVDDWDFTYSPGGASSASVEATDGFSRFARNINGGGSAVVESSGARLGRVLDQLEVNWPAGERDIDAGQATLAAGVLEGEALGYMLDVVEQSELGLLFMSKSGDVAFRERLLATVSDPVRFSDDGLGVPFSGVEIEFGSEDLVNKAIITGPSGTAIENDSKSQILFGITAEEIDTQVSTLAQQEGIAEFLIQKYSVPELRVQGITVNMQGLSSAQQSDVLGLEIGDQVDLQFTPNKIPPTINVRSRIIGVSHDVGLSSHFVSFSLEKLPFQFFVLNDATFGTLDNEDVVLGF